VQFRLIEDKIFVEELSKGLGREIYEKYDPQKYSSDRRPNNYVYMVHNDNFFFAIHLYNGNPFTKKIAKYYYKMELSNLDINDSQYKFFSYVSIITHVCCGSQLEGTLKNILLP
jgi:hypothetical protein